VASGPSFRRGIVSDLPSGNIDIAPTVLRLLGVTTDVALDGRPLVEGLRVAADTPPQAPGPSHHEAHSRFDGIRLVHRAVIEHVGRTRYVTSLTAERR
jgi:arylsulfatase A-like enzyme